MTFRHTNVNAGRTVSKEQPFVCREKLLVTMS